MGLLSWLFDTKKEKHGGDQKHSNDCKGTPVVASLSFRTHLEIVRREFSFLIQDYGFRLTIQDWHGREHVTRYEKDHIQVEVIFEPSALPFVKVRNTTLPYDESRKLCNYDIVEEFDSEIIELRKRYNKRREPMRAKAIQAWNAGGELDFSELEEDYIQNGRAEHISLLIKAALTVRHMLDQNSGVLSG